MLASALWLTTNIKKQMAHSILWFTCGSNFTLLSISHVVFAHSSPPTTPIVKSSFSKFLLNWLIYNQGWNEDQTESHSVNPINWRISGPVLQQSGQIFWEKVRKDQRHGDNYADDRPSETQPLHVLSFLLLVCHIFRSLLCDSHWDQVPKDQNGRVDHRTSNGSQYFTSNFKFEVGARKPEEVQENHRWV